MKEWWINLKLREKQYLTAAGFIIFLFFLYVTLLAPISHYNNSLREEISQQQHLLVSMQTIDTQIRNTEKLATKNLPTQTSATLLSTLQNETKQSPLASNLTQLSQTENNSVQLVFQKVNFDILMKWLSDLLQRKELNVVQMTATPNGSIGVVDATIVLH